MIIRVKDSGDLMRAESRVHALRGEAAHYRHEPERGTVVVDLVKGDMRPMTEQERESLRGRIAQADERLIQQRAEIQRYERSRG